MENKVLITCSRCRLLLTDYHTAMEIKTEMESYIFCLRCLKKAFTSLSLKPNKTTDEVELLSGIREFLDDHKKSRES